MLSVATFEELIPRLTNAIEWFGESGVRISPTRLGQYRRLLTEILELQHTLDRQQAAAKFRDYVNALICAHDIAAIYTAFKDGAYNALIQSRLRQSVGGPVLPQDENASSSGNFARNIEFELVVAAHLVTGGGILMESDDSDVMAALEGATFLVECKRLQSERGVESALSKAKGQLRAAYDLLGNADCVGFIAFDISKTCTAGLQPLRAASLEEVHVWTMERIHGFLERHLPLWNRVEEARTGAVIVRLCVMAEVGSGETNLCYHQHYGVARLDRAPDVEHIVDRVSLALRCGIGQRVSKLIAPAASG